MSWHTDDYPELRSGPPWVMEEMIAAQPELAERMLAAVADAPGAAATAIAARIEAALAAGRPVTVVGCGTSEHGAQGIAAVIRGAVAPSQRALVRAQAALSAALEPCDGVCLAVSHDGGTRATELAARAAKDAGAWVAVVTHEAGGSVAAVADAVVVTPVHDASWCHTIAYTSALLVGAKIAGDRVAAAPAAGRALLDQAIALDARPLAERLADRRVVLCAGAGTDHVSARELALKIAEGARMPTVALELETVLHGQLAGHEAADGLVLVALDDGADFDPVARRAGHVASAARAIGLPVAALLSERFAAELAPELTPAGRLVVTLPDPASLDRRLAALLAGAGALQTLTLQLAHARETNPDLIRREEAPYRAAAQAGEGSPDW